MTVLMAQNASGFVALIKLGWGGQEGSGFPEA